MLRVFIKVATFINNIRCPCADLKWTFDLHIYLFEQNS